MHGKQINGSWKTNEHSDWKFVYKFQTSGMIAKIITQNSDIVILAGKDTLYNFNLSTLELNKTAYSNPMPLFNVGVYGVETQKNITVIQVGGGPLTAYNYLTRSWTHSKRVHPDSLKLYGANILTDSLNRLYLFCGYGWYTSKKSLLRYYEETKKWDSVNIDTRNFFPRTALQWSPDLQQGKYYLLGGWQCNESGIQADGFSNSNEFWKIDLQQNSLERLGMAVIPEGFRFAGDARFHIINGKIFSILSDNINELEPTTSIQLFAGSPPDYKMISVGNPFTLTKDTGFLDLYHSQSTKQLYLVLGKLDASQGLYNWLVYKLSFPVLSHNDLKTISYDNKPTNNFITWLLSGLGITGLGSILFLFWFRRKRKNKVYTIFPLTAKIDNEVSPEPGSARTSTIDIFGEFYAIDEQGNDISPKFTPKIQQLFLLLLFYSADIRNGRKGISLEKLTDILWPNSLSHSAKNSRNVALKSLRDILAKFREITIGRENHHYFLCVNGNAYIDYFIFATLHKQLTTSVVAINGDTINEYFRIVKKGPILSHVSYEWLDPIKASLINEIIDVCIRYSKQANQSPSTMLEIANIILICDSLNQNAIQMKLKSLCTLGNNGAAKAAYDLYFDEYKKVFDEPYSRTFNDLIA
ncbi:MAG: hypothetical protein C0412_13580 [Flavobacterium sp.]|nr:hypothetical protein [Flavobacterium sp.]